MKRPKSKTAEARVVRRQRVVNNTILVATLVVIIAVSAYALSRPTAVTLPSYLNRCIPLRGRLAYNSTFVLEIHVNGVNQTIPALIGIAPGCTRPIHTFTATGAVHVDTDQNMTYTLKDFFLVWGNTYGPTWATFNNQQLFTYQADNAHPIRFTVGNHTDASFENYHLPTGGSSLTNPKVIISYG